MREKVFVNLSDRNDAVVATCDREKGHGGTHHDPHWNADWYDT